MAQGGGSLHLRGPCSRRQDNRLTVQPLDSIRPRIGSFVPRPDAPKLHNFPPRGPHGVDHGLPQPAQRLQRIVSLGHDGEALFQQVTPRLWPSVHRLPYPRMVGHTDRIDARWKVIHHGIPSGRSAISRTASGPAGSCHAANSTTARRRTLDSYPVKPACHIRTASDSRGGCDRRLAGQTASTRAAYST